MVNVLLIDEMRIDLFFMFRFGIGFLSVEQQLLWI